MARCYANENFPFPTVEALRGLGHDVLTTIESGRAGQAIPDMDVLAFAVAEERIVITLNRRHFIRLHHTTPAHAGIIVCTFDLDFAALALCELPFYPISPLLVEMLGYSGQRRVDPEWRYRTRHRGLRAQIFAEDTSRRAEKCSL